MADYEATHKLEDLVQLDDTDLESKRNGGKTGRGAPRDQTFVEVAEANRDMEHASYTVLEPTRTFDNTSQTARWQHRPMMAMVYSNGLACLARCGDMGSAYAALVTEGRRAACKMPGPRQVNTVLANVKPAISRRYHAFKQSKHPRRRFAAAQHRFNR